MLVNRVAGRPVVAKCLGSVGIGGDVGHSNPWLRGSRRVDTTVEGVVANLQQKVVVSTGSFTAAAGDHWSTASKRNSDRGHCKLNCQTCETSWI